MVLADEWGRGCHWKRMGFGGAFLPAESAGWKSWGHIVIVDLSMFRERAPVALGEINVLEIVY